MRAFLDGLYKASGILAALALIGIAVLILGQIVGRAVGGQIKAADEIAGYCLAASLFLALAPTFRRAEHIRVGLLLDRLSPRPRRGLEIACLLFSAALIGYFAWFTIDMVWTSHDIEEVSQGLLPIPLWLPQSAMALGLLVFLVALLDDLVAAVLNGRPAYRAREEAAADLATFER